MGDSQLTGPIGRRIDDLEYRLSLDMLTHAVSKRLKRWLAVGVAVMCLVAAMSVGFISYEIQQNTNLTEGIAVAQANDRKAAQQREQMEAQSKQELSILQGILQKQAAATAEAAIDAKG